MSGTHILAEPVTTVEGQPLVVLTLLLPLYPPECLPHKEPLSIATAHHGHLPTTTTAEQRVTVYILCE